jgi:pimeloyl-ACP methyl ester carboxylesterase
MPSGDSNGTSIAYHDRGRGEPVLLIHGFAATADATWVALGWVEALTGAGRRVVTFDFGAMGRVPSPTIPIPTA